MLRKIAFVVLIIYAIFGMLIISVIIHENSHKKDFEYLAENEEICYLTFNNFSFNSLVGYYSFDYNNKYKEEFEGIEKYTEWKAYALGYIPLIILFWCLRLVLIKEKVENG